MLPNFERDFLYFYGLLWELTPVFLAVAAIATAGVWLARRRSR